MRKLLVFSAILLGLLLIYFYFIPAFAGDVGIISSFEVGRFVFRLYGIILALAILTGYLVACTNSWRFGISKEEVDNLAFWLVIIGIVGARIYYVIFDFGFFWSNPSETYKIWHGGLSIFGAIIAGLIFILFKSKNKAYTSYQLLDLVALSMPLSQAIGRMGNFFNQEAFGRPTNLPWKMYIEQRFRPQAYKDFEFFHPTFLYELAALVVIFFVLRKLLPKLKSGTVFFSYLAMYSLARFLIEPLRVDSVIISGFRVDQVVAFLVIISSFVAILVRFRTIEKKARN